MEVVEWGERLEKQLVLLPQNDPSIRQDRFNNIFSARMKTTSWFFHKRKLTGTEHCQGLNKKQAVLSNRNDFLRFRFLLLKSYGSCYGSSSISHHKKQIFQEKCRNFFAFLPSKLFYKEKVYKFQQIYCEMWMKIFFNEGNQIHNVTVGAQSIALLCQNLVNCRRNIWAHRRRRKLRFFLLKNLGRENELKS